MTPEELLRDIDECYGPCSELCISCPEGHYLKTIRDVLVDLIDERNKYRDLCAENGILQDK